MDRVAQFCADHPALVRIVDRTGNPEYATRLAAILRGLRRGDAVDVAIARIYADLDLDASLRGVFFDLPGRSVDQDAVVIYVCPAGRCDRRAEREAGAVPRCAVAQEEMVRHQVIS